MHIKLVSLPRFIWFLSTEIVQLMNEFHLTDADHEVKIKELHKRLEFLMPRRLKRDVLTSRATESGRNLRVEMSAMQTHFSKNIFTKVRVDSWVRWVVS